MATRQIEFVDDNGFKATFELGSTLTADRVIAIPDQSGTLFSGGGTAMSALVDDLTPQLGGNLDTNGQTINGLTYPTTDGTSGQVLTTDGAGNLTFTTVSGGSGSGEVNTASNVGTGTGLFKQKTGVDLEFKSISGGSGINLSGVDTITLAVTEGDLTLDNLSGTLSVAKGGTGATTAGNARANLGIGTLGEQNANNVTISGGSITGTSVTSTALVNGAITFPATDGTSGQVMITNGLGALSWVDQAGGGETNTASNVGTGVGLFKQKTGTDLEFKSIVDGLGINISLGDTLTLWVQEDELTLDYLGGTLGIVKGGTGATTAGNARANLGIGTLGEQNANNVTISGGSITGTSVTSTALVNGAITFPATDGTSGQVITTNGLGALSWADQSGGTSLELYKENPSTPTAPTVTGANAVGIGSISYATQTGAVAIGTFARSLATNAVAIGANSSVDNGVGDASNSIAFGGGSVTDAQNAHAVFGEIVNGGDYGFAFGMNSKTYNKGQSSHACGYETSGANGDYQVSRYVYRGRTASATPANLLTGIVGDTTDVLAFPTYSTFLVSAQIVAAKDDYTEAAAYEIKGLYRYDSTSGTTNLVGSLNKTVIAEDVAGWDATFTIDVLGRIQFNVTGEASKTINWTANVTVTEVAV